MVQIPKSIILDQELQEKGHAVPTFEDATSLGIVKIKFSSKLQELDFDTIANRILEDGIDIEDDIRRL